MFRDGTPISWIPSIISCFFYLWFVASFHPSFLNLQWLDRWYSRVYVISCSYVSIGNIWFGILVFVDIMVFFSCLGWVWRVYCGVGQYHFPSNVSSLSISDEKWRNHGIIVWNGNNNGSSSKTEMDVVITFDDCNEKCFKMVRQFLGYHWSFLVSFISGLLPHFILPFSIFNGWIGDDIHCSYVPIGNIWFGILVFVDIMVFFSCMGGLLWCRTISFSFKRFFIIYFCFQLASLWLIFFWSFGILSNNLDFIFC